MPTRARRPNRSRDTNRVAWQVVQESTEQTTPPELLPDTRNPAAVALAELGAKKGGFARAKKLSSQKRKQIAQNAAKARWAMTPKS